MEAEAAVITRWGILAATACGEEQRQLRVLPTQQLEAVTVSKPIQEGMLQ